MSEIIYRELGANEMQADLLDHFNRHQETARCWVKEGGRMVLRDLPFTEDWGSDKKADVIRELADNLRQGGAVFGAFDGSRLIGFASLSPNFFETRHQYLDVPLLHVSLEYRGKGIGKQLFTRLAGEAKSRGADKLYISTNPAEASQAFYKAVGCVEAEEINEILAELEPYDCQLEYAL